MKKILQNFLTKSEQGVLLFLISFALIGAVVKYSGFLAEEDPILPEIKEDHQILYDLRTVTQKELVLIKGIGEKRAADILAYRDQFGFNCREDLLNVKGIGQATFEKISLFFLEFGGVTPPTDPASRVFSKTESSSEPARIVNLNRAGMDELVTLPGIGPAKAERILAYRNAKGRFENIEELKNIKGIGEKTFEKLRPFLTTGGTDGQ
ncbi:MAG: ComEA family DNA-binding protein [Candidatus Cloacimonetes bacterium]|nr:ComEA family DNA-binding protein [Candidatus Cloacimonadota bacterium]